MKPQVSLHEFMPYGAPDLMAAQRPDLSRALAVSSAATFAAFLLMAALLPMAPSAPPKVVMPKIIDMLDEPMVRLKDQTPPSVKIHGGSRPLDPRLAMPRLVREEPVTPDIPAAYEEYSKQVQKDPGGSAPTGTEEMFVASENADLPVTYADQWPVVVTKVKPDYPQIAHEAMVDGQVIVLVLIGRDGRVREAKLEEKHHVPMLDAAALEAARKWVFSPALVNGQPVAVWTAIPFRFTLQ